MCTSLDLVRFISTKNAQREIYILKLLLHVYKFVLWLTLEIFFACLFSIRTCFYVMCQPKLDLSWSFALKTNVTCDVLQTQYKYSFLWFINVIGFYLLTCDYFIKQTKFYKYISNIISNYFLRTFYFFNLNKLTQHSHM